MQDLNFTQPHFYFFAVEFFISKILCKNTEVGLGSDFYSRVAP